MNQMGGFGDMDAMQEGWEILCDDYGEEKALELMRACAYKNAVACMRLGLFDNPYCSIQHVIETNWTEETIAYGIETQLKAMVMLKNNGLIKDNTASEEKLTVYMPASFTAGGMVSGWRGPSYQKAKAEFGFSVPELEKYFNVITDTIGEPTGKAPDDTEEYQLSDITAPSAEELANVDFILMPMNGPYTASSVDDKYDAEADEEYGMYTAPNLQYHGRTASGARNPSIGGEMQTITFNDGYEMQTSIRKANLSYWNKTVADATTITQLQKLEELKAMGLAAPIVVVMKANNSGAMCWHEVEPLADVIFYRYGSVSDTAAAQILAGKVEPSALLVQQQPISMEVVDKDQEDVPRDLECYVDAAGNAYDFAFGLNWSGKIEDERVATYTAAPLTKVENMEFKYADAM
jgi:beta-glucosidase